MESLKKFGIRPRQTGDGLLDHPDIKLYDLVLSVRSADSKRLYLFPVTLTTILTALVAVLLLIIIFLQVLVLIR